MLYVFIFFGHGYYNLVLAVVLSKEIFNLINYLT